MSNNTDQRTTQEMVYTHPWMTAGLGNAPFVFIRMQENLYYPCRDISGGVNTSVAPVPGGTCAYCGQGIRYECVIKSADGKEFTVGQDCVQKVGQSKLTTAVEAARKKIERERKDAAREATRQAALQAQRDANGGLTDYELREKQRMERIDAEYKAMAPVREMLAPLAKNLKNGEFGFRDSIARQLEIGQLPRGNAFHLTCEILAKRAGRKGSEKYNAEFDRIEKVLNDAQSLTAEVSHV